MVSFPSPLSAPQYATARTSGYWVRVLSVFNDNQIIWQARANESKTTPFKAFAWATETVGSYTDVVEGLICYISETTDLRRVKYRGRVRLAPSSTQFFIDYNAAELVDGDYITVVCDTDFMRRVRDDELVDGGVAYHDLPPVLGNHPSVIVLYDSDSDSQCPYTPEQIGIPVDAAASTVDTWAWSVIGGGTSSIDDPTLEHPVFTFEAGYHYLLRVEFEDDNGVSNWHMAHVYAITRTFDAPVIQPVVAGTINGDLDSGWTADLTAYGGVSTLLNRNHCAVFSVEHFGDHSSTPLVSNVLTQGRVRSYRTETESTDDAAYVQQSTFNVEGITAYLQREQVPNDIVRATDTPDEWGEMTAPNPFRMAVYEMWAYTTLTNVCAFSVDTDAFAAYQIGAEPRGIDGGSALDSLKSILWDTVKALPNFAPSGEIRLARTASYIEDRSSLETIAVFTLQDIIKPEFDIDSSRTTSQVIAFAGALDTNIDEFVLYTSSAPTIPYGEGDIKEITREILTVDSTTTEAATEIGLRASNHYAFENSKPLMTLTLIDSYGGLLIPTNYQRYAAVIPSTSNTSGVSYGSSDYWQLQSVTLSIGADGTVGTGGEFYRETSFDDALIIASLLPINLSNQNPVLPVLPNDPAFPTDPLELYPTDTPIEADRQPLDPFSGMQAYSPFPPDVAAQAAANQGSPGCKTLRVNYRNNTNAESGWTTVLSNDYLMTLSGIASVGTVITPISLGFLVASGEPEVTGDFGETGYSSAWTGSVGWVGDGPFADRNFIQYNFASPTYVSTVTFNWSTVADYTNANWWIGSSEDPDGFGSPTLMTDGQQFASKAINAAVDFIRVGFERSGFSTTFVANLVSLEILTEAPGDGILDAFYRWTLDGDGKPINPQLLDSDGGLFLDNSKYTEIPDANTNHEYTGLPFTGTGNPLFARMVFDDYSGISSKFLFIEMCPKG